MYTISLPYEKLIRLLHFLAAYTSEWLEQEKRKNRCLIN